MSGAGESERVHPGRLVIRADASPSIGAGHIVRSLALGQAWLKIGGEVTFVTAKGGQWLKAWLKPVDIPTIFLDVEPGTASDSGATACLARELEARWVVVDGYHFTGDYQHELKRSGLRLLLIDDLGRAGRYYADVVLNQNLHARATLYADREPYTALLLGTRYALLRQEFLVWQGWLRKIPEVAGRVLVTLGGGQAGGNILPRIMEALRHLEVEGIEVLVLGGEGEPDGGAKAQLGGSGPWIRVLPRAPGMAEVMAWADVAVSAGGTTCWELAFMGLPALVVVLTDHQRLVAEHLAQAGAAVNLGWHSDLTAREIVEILRSLLITQQARAEMSWRGRQLVDGEGCCRTIAHLKRSGAE